MLVPLIRRDAVPFVRLLERVGKRVYGLYLMHLSILTLVLWLIERLDRNLLGAFVVLVPVLFVIAVSVLPFLVETVSRSRLSPAYRYIFG